MNTDTRIGLSALLLIPGEDFPDLLTRGPLTARPPVVLQHPVHGTWHDYGWGAGSDVRALALVWEGVALSAGIAWLLKDVNDLLFDTVDLQILASMAKIIIEDSFNIEDMEPLISLLSRFGQLVFIDSHGGIHP